MRKQLCFNLRAVFVLAIWLQVLYAAPEAQPASQLASQLFPGYTKLVLSASTTSSIQEAIKQAKLKAEQPPTSFIVVLSSTVKTLVVDAALTMQPGESWVLATSAALQAATTDTPVAEANMLTVRCAALRKGSFIEAIDGFESLSVLGLTIQDCPSTAINLSYGKRLLLADSQLIGNNAKNQQVEYGGGSLLLTEIEQVELRRSVCSKNTVLLNGGCLNGLKIGELIAINSTFSDNSCAEEVTGGRYDGGAALFLEQSGKVAVKSCMFSGNTASSGSGGGLFCNNCGDMVVANTKFSSNSAGQVGGGIYGAEVASLTVTECEFRQNGPLPQGGLTVAGSAIAMDGSQTTDNKAIKLVVRQSTLIGNEAEKGTIATTQYSMMTGKVEVHDCVFTNNKATIESAGVFIEENVYTELLLTNTVFKNNDGDYGGAVGAYDADVTVTNCTFINNTAATDGGAVHLFTMQAAGSGNKLKLADSVFYNNTAGKFGGAVAVYTQDVVIDNSTFTLNLGGGGGALYVENAPAVSISNSVFDENTSDRGSGGALRLNIVGRLDITDTKLDYNSALTFSGTGGGMYLMAVATATFRNVNATQNSAKAAGGAASIFNSENITWSNSIIGSNTAPLGAGVAVDGTSVLMQSLVVEGNEAAAAVKDDAGRRRLHQVKSNADVYEFATETYALPSGGAILAQQSGVSLEDCTLHNNTAEGDAGALLVQWPTAFAAVNTAFTENTAQAGTGGAFIVRGAGDVVAAGIKSCNFTRNAARKGSGGAAVIDSGLGPLELTCEGCLFEGNSAGESGGAVAAAGPTSFTCTACQSQQNTARHHGGWLHCSGCSNLSIAAGKSTSNAAGAAGGAVSCTDCGSFSTEKYEFSNNNASSGGAVAVQSATSVAATGCSIADNSAGRITKDAVISPLVKRVYQLPASWQNMYGVGSAAAAFGCNAEGAGGGWCMAGVESANMADNTLTNNQGSTGGALFASANCDTSGTGCQPNQVKVTGLTARRNLASEAGGVLYTTTPEAVILGPAGVDTSTPAGMYLRAAVLEQLSEDNKVGEDGYGPAVASFPSELSLMWPVQEGKVTPVSAPDAPDSSLQERQQQGGRAGRKLQQVPWPPGNAAAAVFDASRTDVQRQVEQVFQMSSTATAATSGMLQPFCPALGASVFETRLVAIDSGRNFSLPVHILDSFGSQVLSGPGSDWVVALQSSSPDTTRQLSGALRGQLSGGSVVLQGLSLAGEAGSNMTVVLTAIPPPGSGDKPLSAEIQVQIRPCLAGEYVMVDTTTSGAQSLACRVCAAPTYSFIAQPQLNTSGSSTVCQSCPARGICAAGMLIPESGNYQAHPRSAVIRKCPHARACERDVDAQVNLQGLQCSYRRYLAPEQIDPRPYTQLQCNKGYAGPYCSSCYRAGRNAWLLQQLERSIPHEKGYTVGDEMVIATGTAEVFAKLEVYGKANGRCARCPHLAVAWVGFFLSRCVDMLVIALMALLWIVFGWLSKSAAAAAFVELKRQRLGSMRMRSSILGSNKSSFGSQKSVSMIKGQRQSGLLGPRPSGTTEAPRALGNQATMPPASRGANGSQTSTPPLSFAQPVVVIQHSVAPPAPGAAVSPFADAAASALPSTTASDTASVGAPDSRATSQTMPATRHGSGLLYNLSAAPSLHWASAVNMVNMLRDNYAGSIMVSDGTGISGMNDADSEVVQPAALLLMAMKHLACLAQVVLDGAQLAAVLLSLDLMYYVPDWAATSLSAVLLTQANTWQYVPFECLIPGGSAASAAVVQSVLVTVLPVIYVAALYPILMTIRKMSTFSKTQCAEAIHGPGNGNNKLPSSRAASKDTYPSPPRASKERANMWKLLTALAVASMAYCYSFYVANIAAAFNCMSLATQASVPGEVHIKGTVWVPDMQLECTSPPQAAAMAIAAVIGIPLLVGYYMLLLTLAWPAHATPASARTSQQSSPALRALSNYWRSIKQACLIPLRLLERPTRICQAYTAKSGISGEDCAALGVWNVEWRWWWLPARELLKLALVVAATVSTMRGPEAQARVLLLLVVVAAAINWRVQAGCGTSMNQLQFLAFCWLQLLALLILVPSMVGVNPAAFGGFIVALVACVMAQCAYVMACLVLRSIGVCRQMSSPMLSEIELPRMISEDE